MRYRAIPMAMMENLTPRMVSLMPLSITTGSVELAKSREN